MSLRHGAFLVHGALGACALAAACSDYGSEERTDAGSDAGVADASDALVDVTPSPPPELAVWGFELGATDETGSKHDLTLTGVTVGEEIVHAGRGALASEGKPDTYAEQLSLSTEGFPVTGTLSLWFHSTGLATATPGVARNLFDNFSPERSHFYVRLSDASPVKLEFIAQIKDQAFTFNASSAALEEGRWYHAVLTWTATRAAGYLDGKLVGEGELGGGFRPTDQAFRIGRAFKGAIDDVRLWSTALSTAQVAELP